MAISAKFTEATISKIAKPAKRQNYRDTDQPHLYLRAETSGSKIFYFVCKVSGRMRWVKIGQSPEITLKEARAACKDLGAKAARGDDLKKLTKASTIDELFQRRQEHATDEGKRSVKADAAMYKNTIGDGKGGARIGGRRANDLKTIEVKALHKRWTKERGPITANRALALLSLIYGHANKHLEANIGNPTKGVTRNQERPRKRYLDKDEIQRFFAALDDPQTKDWWRDLFYLAILTGARRGNIMSMRWKDVDLRTGVWTIPATDAKANEPIRLPLHTEALAIIKDRKSRLGGLKDGLAERTTDIEKRRRKIGNATNQPLDRASSRLAHDRTMVENGATYVFPADRSKGHRTDPKKGWYNICKRAGLVDENGKHTATPHDLRRTLGSWQAASNTSLLMIGKTLGHRSTKSTEVYAHIDIEPIRNAVQTVGDEILATRQRHEPTAPVALYGYADTPAGSYWFHTEDAASRFAAAFGWTLPISTTTTAEVDAATIHDTPTTPWAPALPTGR